MTFRSLTFIPLACALAVAAPWAADSKDDSFALGHQDDVDRRASILAREPMIMPNGVSVPGDFPHIEVYQHDQPAEGFLFLSNWRDGSDSPPLAAPKV